MNSCIVWRLGFRWSSFHQYHAGLSAHRSIRAVYAAEFSPDGHTLATASADHTARLWNVTDPRHPGALATLTSHRGVPPTFRIADPIRSVPEWRG